MIQVRSSVNPTLYPFVDLGGLAGGGYIYLPHILSSQKYILRFSMYGWLPH